jgi:hypothetical protein
VIEAPRLARSPIDATNATARITPSTTAGSTRRSNQAAS